MTTFLNIEQARSELIAQYQDLQRKAGRFNQLLLQTKEVFAARGANVKWLDKMMEECLVTIYSQKLAELAEDRDSDEEERQMARHKIMNSR